MFVTMSVWVWWQDCFAEGNLMTFEFFWEALLSGRWGISGTQKPPAQNNSYAKETYLGASISSSSSQHSRFLFVSFLPLVYSFVRPCFNLAILTYILTDSKPDKCPLFQNTSSISLTTASSLR